MRKDIDKIAFEYWAGLDPQIDLENWAELEIKKTQPRFDAGKLFNLHYEEAKKESLRLSKEIHDFSPVSEKGELWAQELLLNYCRKLLNEEIKPLEFCRLVNRFDVGFLDMHLMEDNKVYYPEWLGNLWNCCDWCDDSWELLNAPQLAIEVKRLLQVIADSKLSS